jgi:hypothetical protein
MQKIGMQGMQRYSKKVCKQRYTNVSSMKISVTSLV